MPSLDELYSRVDDLYDREGFEDKVHEKEEEYEGLFDEEAIAHLIVAEHDRNDSNMEDICDVEPGEEATIEGRVINLGQLRTFEKDDREGRVRNIRLDDGTGSIKLVLWDEDTEMAGEEIKTGDELRIINGYIQDRGYGLQIQTGKWGQIELRESEEEKD